MGVSRHGQTQRQILGGRSMRRRHCRTGGHHSGCRLRVHLAGRVHWIHHGHRLLPAPEHQRLDEHRRGNGRLQAARHRRDGRRLSHGDLRDRLDLVAGRVFPGERRHRRQRGAGGKAAGGDLCDLELLIHRFMYSTADPEIHPWAASASGRGLGDDGTRPSAVLRRTDWRLVHDAGAQHRNLAGSVQGAIRVEG